MAMWDVLGPERNQAGELIPETGERCAKCEKVRIAKPDAGPVRAHRSSSGAWRHSGLSICNNAHACPECAYRRARKVAGELSACMSKWTSSPEALAPDVWLLTLTLPHTAKTPWSTVVERLRDGWRLMTRSVEWASFQKRWGVVGAPRVWDSTIGRNGLHGHWHIALFVSHAVWDAGAGIRPMAELDPDTRAAVLSEVQAELEPMWERAGRAVQAVTDRNVAAFHEHGVDLRAGESSAAYLVKWGIPEELALGPVKRGHTHWQLLDAAARGSRDAAQKFRDYYEATRGLPVITGVAKLRKRLAIDDDELAAHLEELATLRELQAEADGETIVKVPELSIEIRDHQFHCAIALGWHAIHRAADAADESGADPQAAVDELLTAYQTRKRELSRKRAPPALPTY